MMGKTNDLLPKALEKLKDQGFNEMGTRYPLWHLHVVGSFMAYLPAHIQERYADAITVAFTDTAAKTVSNWDFIKDLDVETYLQINCTGIGNMAYIAGHASGEGDRLKAAQLLATIQRFALQNIDEIVAAIVQAAKEAMEAAVGDNGS